MDTSFITEQQERYFETLEGPQLVPPTIFLPKERDDALHVIKELLYLIRNETLRLDFVTHARDQLCEVLDLIERS